MGVYAELRKQTPKVTGSLVRMRQETFTDAAVPAKYKVLAALSIAIVIRCEPCIRAYVKKAFEAGATYDEFIDGSLTLISCPDGTPSEFTNLA